MAKRFLTHIDATGNQIVNASFEKLAAAPGSGNFEGRMYYDTVLNVVRVYTDSNWVDSGLPIVSADPASGNYEGRIVYNTTSDSIRYYNGTSWSGLGAGSITSISNSDGNLSITGTTGINIDFVANPTVSGITAGNVKVGVTTDNKIDTSTGNLTIDSAGGTTTVDDNLIVTGDLTVSGTTTTINTQTLSVADNVVTLNSDFTTGTPTENAGIEVRRGSLSTVSIRWNETNDTWELTRDGTNYEEITTVGAITSGDISDFTEAAQDAVGAMLVDGTTIDFTYTDATPALTAEVKLAGTSYLSTTSGLAVDKSALETALTTDGYTRKYSANVGNGVLTSIAVTHNLGTKDVIVNIYDNVNSDTVEADVVRTDVNTVTVSFAVAPTSNAYRVVVIG